MPTDVVMPQLGESIFEGTITKWLKQPGEAIEKDEPLFEISTDKVDAEIPAPVSGTLSEIRAAEGETVEVNTVVAVIAEGVRSASLQTSREKPQPVSDPAAKRAIAAKPQTAEPKPQAEVAPRPEANSGSTEVVMPQLGESIFEGTITQWFKKAGDAVEKDERLFEVSTDKVDAEIPAPVSGILREICVSAGETVQVNTVVAVIGGSEAVAQPDGEPASGAAEQRGPATGGSGRRAAFAGSDDAACNGRHTGTPESLEAVRSSPLVRRIARENNLDLRRIRGTGANGRITKEDVLRALKEGAAQPNTERIPGAPETVRPAAVDSPGGGRSRRAATACRPA